MAGLDPNIDWGAIQALVDQGYKANPDGTITTPQGAQWQAPSRVPNQVGGAVRGEVIDGRVVYRPVVDATTGNSARMDDPRIGNWGEPGWTPPDGYAIGVPRQQAKPDRANRVDFAARARALFGFLPDVLLDVFVNAYDENNGDTELAKTVMRQHTAYDQYYAGNRRGDGTVRLDEAEYVSTVEGHNRRRGLYGMTPLSPELQRRLIEADVSPDEYGSRLAKTYVQLASNIEAVRQDYAERWGATNLSDAALMESATDPGVNPLEAERRIRTSSIGGEARVRGFSLATAEAERMESLGLDQKAARALYGQAQSELPKLNEMVGRFNDPDDPLTIEDFADAVVLTDADQAARIGRLYGQQRSLFSTQDLFTRDQGGGLTGLLDR